MHFAHSTGESFGRRGLDWCTECTVAGMLRSRCTYAFLALGHVVLVDFFLLFSFGDAELIHHLARTPNPTH